MHPFRNSQENSSQPTGPPTRKATGPYDLMNNGRGTGRVGLPHRENLVVPHGTQICRIGTGTYMHSRPLVKRS